jgi:hypothetical protein
MLSNIAVISLIGSDDDDDDDNDALRDAREET